MYFEKHGKENTAQTLSLADRVVDQALVGADLLARFGDDRARLAGQVRARLGPAL